MIEARKVSGLYQSFLESKTPMQHYSGKQIQPGDINECLFPFQRDIVRWAVRKGRCAIFADTGLGKTFMQVEYARLISSRCLIVAPLSVARQTQREAEKIGQKVKYVRHQSEVDGQISITNYEMIREFEPDKFDAVVLDESSILKALDGKTRKLLTDMFSKTKYRLCCTATPAPNDESEIGNHSEFLGVLKTAEMLSAFFVHDEQEWRLKGHAHNAFYKWMASWSISIRKPSDLGYEDNGYILPPLKINPYFVTSKNFVPTTTLFPTMLSGIAGRSDARRGTLEDRLKELPEIVSRHKGQWIIWTGLNDESSAVAKMFTGKSIEIVGADSIERKVEMLEAFQSGKHRILITKPKIAGHGMNFQNAHNMIFFGMNDSFEAYYQCVRRCYRFGQTQPVNVYIVLSEVEKPVYQNVMQKERVALSMSEELIKNVQQYEKEELEMKTEVEIKHDGRIESGNDWTAMLGDSCLRMKELKDESIDLSVYSPPFASLYTYSPLIQDLGNSKNWDEFFSHYKFIIQEILRVTKPGRLTCVHSADIPAMMGRDGYIGLKDFPGAIVKAYIDSGWIFHGRITIDKNPQAQAIRTHSKALLFVQMEKDSSWSRPAIGDYMLLFRKPGENKVPIRPVENGELNRNDWIRFASPIWLDINESDTLQYSSAREDADERHICPLQLEVIERCIKLWSNPREVVLSPFGGIGSEGYVAVKLNRRATIIELKESYFEQAVANLKNAEALKLQRNLFPSQAVVV